jgi:hypothetical protein
MARDQVTKLFLLAASTESEPETMSALRQMRRVLQDDNSRDKPAMFGTSSRHLSLRMRPTVRPPAAFGLSRVRPRSADTSSGAARCVAMLCGRRFNRCARNCYANDFRALFRNKKLRRPIHFLIGRPHTARLMGSHRLKLWASRT